MAGAGYGDKVRVRYVGTLDDGKVFESSSEGAPLEFTVGQSNVMPGIEEGILGMEPGESKSVRVTADKAYGPHLPEKVIEVDASQVPFGEPEIGMRLKGTQKEGERLDLRVVAITGDKVTLDGNHPLAGKDLTFELELLEIL